MCMNALLGRNCPCICMLSGLGFGEVLYWAMDLLGSLSWAMDWLRGSSWAIDWFGSVTMLWECG